MKTFKDISIINYDEILEYFISNFPDSKIITSTTAESMKLILRKERIRGSWAQIGVEEDKMIVFEKADSFKSIGDEVGSVIRREIYKCLLKIKESDFRFKMPISKIVYFESIALNDTIPSTLSIEVVKLHEILDFILPIVPGSEIIDTGHDSRIILGPVNILSERKGMGQLVVKGEHMILTPNMSYFSAAQKFGEGIEKGMDLIISLSNVLNENSLFIFNKDFRLNWSTKQIENEKNN